MNLFLRFAYRASWHDVSLSAMSASAQSEVMKAN